MNIFRNIKKNKEKILASLCTFTITCISVEIICVPFGETMRKISLGFLIAAGISFLLTVWVLFIDAIIND